MASKAFLFWLAENGHRVKSTTWSLLASTEPQQKVLEIFGLEDMPLVTEDTAQTRGASGKRRRIIESVEPPSSPKITEEIHPFDVGKQYEVNIDGESPAVFTLMQFEADGNHVIQWYYTPEQATHVDFTERQQLIDRVDNIGGVALFESNHQQKLDTTIEWNDVTEKISPIVPTCSIPNIDFYVIGKIDVTENKLVECDNTNAVATSLLAIGKDGGRYLQKNIEKLKNFKSISPAFDTCDACGLRRKLKFSFDMNDRTMRVGSTCAGRIKLAYDVICEDDPSRRIELLNTAEITGWHT